MAKRADTPCAGCGKLLWSGPKSLPAGQRMCRGCRNAPPDPDPEPEIAAEVPQWVPGAALGPRGRALWRELFPKTPRAEQVLLEEASRLADRCDRLDEFLRGHGEVWLRFQSRNEDGSVVTVVVDKALSEARQQASTLRGLLAELCRDRGKADEPEQESRRDELAKRREERRRAAGL